MERASPYRLVRSLFVIYVSLGVGAYLNTLPAQINALSESQQRAGLCCCPAFLVIEQGIARKPWLPCDSVDGPGRAGIPANRAASASGPVNRLFCRQRGIRQDGGETHHRTILLCYQQSTFSHPSKAGTGRGGCTLLHTLQAGAPYVRFPACLFPLFFCYFVFYSIFSIPHLLILRNSISLHTDDKQGAQHQKNADCQRNNRIADKSCHNIGDKRNHSGSHSIRKLCRHMIDMFTLRSGRCHDCGIRNR